MTLFPYYNEETRRFFGQAAQIIVDDVFPRKEKRYKEDASDPSVNALELSHKKLSRELGVKFLVAPRVNRTWNGPGGTPITQAFPVSIHQRTTNYLCQATSEASSPELFSKFRISLIEICLQEKQSRLNGRRSVIVDFLKGLAGEVSYENLVTDGVSWHSKEKISIEVEQREFDSAVFELNERFRQARMPLSYHNGLIQLSSETALEEQLERPFWSLVSQAKWQNVDQLLKEAIDKRDRSERDSVTPALQALESVVKIISAENGWNTGKERGAAHFIDNLVAERNGKRFIEVWEKDALNHLFGKIRNNFSHGPGDDPLPTLLPEQTDWAIDTAMVWIKSLVRRCK